eukprot:jgi/Undpi1/9907/HiC_scaffold_28.g12361.m1
MDEDHSEDGGQPSGQENGDADFIEAGEIAAEYEVGEGNQDAGADEEEDEEEGGEGVPVEDMAATTFKGHSDAVYCVAVNPKNPSQPGTVCRFNNN